VIYRPAVTETHTPEPGVDPSATRFTSEPSRWLGRVERALKSSDRRIEVVQSSALFPDTNRLMTAEDVSARLAELGPGTPPPDLTLAIGRVRQRVLDDVDLYQPLVGYAKTRYHAETAATIIDAHDVGGTEPVRFETEYSDMIAQVFYGVMTIGRPQAAIQKAIVDDITRRARLARPSGRYRVLILAQLGPAPDAPPAGTAGTQSATGGHRRACGCRVAQANAASDSR
jgi:hypothetical protein